MTELRMFDGATPWTDDAHPNNRDRINAAKAADAIALSVYIRGTPGDMRHANLRDVNAVRAAGLGVYPNWESTNDFFRTATTADVKAAGDEALAAARALDFPDDGSVTLPFSWDYEVPQSGWPRAKTQLDILQDRLGDHFQASGYAQIGLIQYWHNHGYADRGFWLMASTFRATSQFTPAEVGHPAVAVVQSHHADGTWFGSPVLPGGATDVDVITQPHLLGAWWPEGSEYANMALSPDDKKWLQANTVSRAELGALLAEFGVVVLTGKPSGDFTAKSHPAFAQAASADAATQAAITKALADLATAVANVKPAVGGTLNVTGSLEVSQ